MGRRLLGYRVRGIRAGRVVVYLRRNAPISQDLEWVADKVSAPATKSICSYNLEEWSRKGTNETELGTISDVKIVAVYLKTNEYKSSLASEQVREDLGNFNRAILDEIERRNIDAIVEPESFKNMPTTLRFRGTNGDFVWLPIVCYAVVDGSKDTRASRTVDRMLSAIGDVAKSLSRGSTC